MADVAVSANPFDSFSLKKIEKEEEEKGKIRRKSRRIRQIKYGDFCFLHAAFHESEGVLLEENKTVRLNIGKIKHSDIVGKYYGEKIYNDTGKWVVALSPSPEIITLGLKHHTQIIYHADISLILMLLEACPGKNIVEAGTGSCSLTCSLARAVSPHGKIFSFEFHKERHLSAIDSIKSYGMSGNVELRLRDVCELGFFSSDLPAEKIDAFFLDLPSPWLAIKHAHQCLKEGGRIVTFSPCIEQVQTTIDTLLQLDYYASDIRTFEILCKSWAVRTCDEDEKSGTDTKTRKRERHTSKYYFKKKRKQNGLTPTAAQEDEAGDTNTITNNNECEIHNNNHTPANNSTYDEDGQDKSTSVIDGVPSEEDRLSGNRMGSVNTLLNSNIFGGRRPLECAGYYCNYHIPMKSHTGYITVAIKNLSDEMQLP